MFKRIALSLTVAAVLATAATAQIELTVNGDFKTGDTSGWSLPLGPAGGQTWGVTGDAASGSFAGELFNPLEGTAWPVKQANIGIGPSSQTKRSPSDSTPRAMELTAA